MAITIPGSVTGAAQNGLTSPTYTLTQDTAPDMNAKQAAVTALGGTQTGVNIHTVSSPFTLTYTRPKQFATAPVPNISTGLVSNVPMNVYKQIVRKGVLVASGQIRPMLIRVEISVPAGADTYDAVNVKAGLSLAAGGLYQLSAGIGDTLSSGVM